jgi:hypothetical protein
MLILIVSLQGYNELLEAFAKTVEIQLRSETVGSDTNCISVCKSESSINIRQIRDPCEVTRRAA